MGGEEYASFHYLMHDEKKPEGRVQYAEAPKPLKFEELYSPRGETPQAVRSAVSIGSIQEKDYWRTRDRIAFKFYENRHKRVMIITCKDMSKSDGAALKTILVDLSLLYFEVDAKLRGSREPVVKKTDKAFKDDASLHKAVTDYLLARLNIIKDPVEWPLFDASYVYPPAPTEEGEGGESADDTEDTKAATEATDATGATAVDGETAAVTAPTGPLERMVSLTKLSADVNTLELPIELLPSLNISLDVIDPSELKLEPTVKAELKSEESQIEAEAVTEAEKEKPKAEESAAQINTGKVVTGAKAQSSKPVPKTTPKKAPASAAPVPGQKTTATATATAKSSPNPSKKGAGASTPAAGSGNSAVKALKNGGNNVK